MEIRKAEKSPIIKLALLSEINRTYDEYGGFMLKKFLKKMYFTSIILTVFFSLGMTVSNAETTIGVVVADSLNVRATASSTAEIIAEIEAGSQVVLLERVGDWYKVNVGIEGYVNAGYVKTEAEIAASNVQAQSVVSTSSATITKGQQVIDIAKQYIGVPYVYGGSTPSGFDCSGLVQYVYRHMGINLNRVAADQAEQGVYVAKENLQPGDLVFFKKSGRVIHHVGLYVGNGNYLHAPYTGRSVTIEPMTRSDYYTARRIFN